MDTILNDIDPLLLSSQDKFQVNKYLGLYLKSNSSNPNFLDLHSLIIKLEKYLQGDIINTKYASILQKNYSSLIAMSKVDVLQKHPSNKKLFSQLNSIMETISYFNNNNEDLAKTQKIVKVLINSYNLRFVVALAESIQQIIIEDVHEIDLQHNDIDLIMHNFKNFSIILQLIGNVDGITDISYFENMKFNIESFKGEHFKNIVNQIIKKNYIDEHIWKSLINISKNDFKLAIDECLKDCINTTDTQFMDIDRFANEIVNKSHKIIDLELYLTNNIEVYSKENAMLKISGLKLYIKEKFGYHNAVVASLHNLYIVKISKIIKSKSSLLQDNKRHAIYKLLKTRFDQDELLKLPQIHDFALKKLNESLSI